MKHSGLLTAVGAAIMLAATGCGTEPSPSAPSAETASATTSSAGAPAGPSAPRDSGTVIGITIAAGAVTPTNAEAQTRAGQPIVLQVSSDAPDSIHVHSVPAHVFEVKPGPDQRFEFTVDVPGKVDVELHEVNRTIVTITVLPG